MTSRSQPRRIIMARETRLELITRESKSLVIPFHHSRMYMVGREGIEPTRAIKTRDLQSRPAPYGITYPYINSNLTYLNLTCTSLLFMNNSVNTMKDSRLPSTIRPTRDNTCFLSPYREYLRIEPKPRLSTRPQLVLHF